MKVLKFGGTSVGSAQRMKEVASLICDGDQKIVVLSAMSGTTNTLVEIADYLYKKNPVSANEVINKMEQKYAAVVEELYSKEETKAEANAILKGHFDYLRKFTQNNVFLFWMYVLCFPVMFSLFALRHNLLILSEKSLLKILAGEK